MAMNNCTQEAMQIEGLKNHFELGMELKQKLNPWPLGLLAAPKGGQTNLIFGSAFQVRCLHVLIELKQLRFQFQQVTKQIDTYMLKVDSSLADRS